MNRHFLSPKIDHAPRSTATSSLHGSLLPAVAGCALVMLLAAGSAAAQVITVDTGGGNGPVASAGQVDRQFAQVAPTHVDLPKTEMDPKTRILLIRDLQSEQGFANRPFPRGHKGLTLEANGKLDPAGVNYLNMVVNEGLSAKPGTRVVVTDIKIDKSRIILDFDGGPDAKHRFLRHIQISAGPEMGDPDMDPSLMNQAGDPAGSRVTLVFPNYVPVLTSAQVKALLEPLISFDVKTPIQAYTDTLPTALKNAILDHKVLVGMNTDMVMFSKGQPNSKSREMDGQMPFEEWIYGVPPQEVDFVRINGNRVIRVEIAKEGQPLAIFTKDVVEPMLMAAGTPELASQPNTRTIREGDVETDPNKQEAAPPPSLRNPGEKLPTDNQTTGVMRPVQFPKPHTDDVPGANPDEQTSAPPASAPPASTPPASAPASPSQPAQPAPQNSQSQPAGGTQPSAPASTAPTNATPPNGGKQQQPSPSNQLVSVANSQ
ncbi:MAG: hypothetical protein ABSE53_14800 [Terracidiphilus sp.]|jgi:hypothetical protein